MLVHCTNMHSITPEIAHLPHPWLPILTVKSHMRMSKRMLLCVCVVVVGDLLLSTSIYLTAACVKYINTNMKGDIWVVRWVCVDLSFKDHLGIHAWCAEAQPFSFCVKPTGFLCLCGSQSKLQQVRQRQTGWKRKPSSLTFNVKDDLRKKISIGRHTE